MKEKNQGVVIPFELAGSRMRRSAQEYRRHGQALDALALIRRAAEQEDTAAGWQALAAELRQLGNPEAAAALLGRVLSREDHAPSAWLEMARCQATLDAKALAADCLYHQLQEDPWSSEADAARAMLPEMEAVQELREPHRTSRLIQRGLLAWSCGNAALGQRRLKRAVRLTARKEGLMITMALLHIAQWDFRSALSWLARAMRLSPESPRVLCNLAAVLQQMNKRRMALAFLRKAAPACIGPKLEEQFLTTAWAINAWTDMEQYLQRQMKRTPYRTALLSAKATMRHEQGRRQEAAEIWRQMLSIDPYDRSAAAMLAWTRRYPEQPLPPGRLPAYVTAEQRTQLAQAVNAGTAVLKHGSEARRMMEWFAVSRDQQEQSILFEAAKAQPDREAEKRFLQELLARGDTAENVRRQALMRLAEMEHFVPLTMLLGDRYTTAQCQPVSEKKARKPWRMFLPLLLRETRQYGQGMEITHFAAALWPCMTRAQQLDAATEGGYLWCKAFEVLWLRHTGREEEAVRVVGHMPVSPRRVSRLLRQLAQGLQA